MLKNLMHSSHSRSDSNRASQSAYASARPAEASKAAESANAEAARPAPADEGSKLIVGPNIKLKGSEITDCEILVVEGRVEASMKSRDIRIAEGGVFSGKAEIDVAEVRGNFEGELTARKRLVIHATGKVTGTIRYGAMMVEEGGSISGDVATLAAGNAPARAAESAAQATTAESTQEPVAAGSTYFRNQAGRR
ncbi:polymer-forming cytoskeletal protein [Betaproteobacteria bacterium SCN2]|jgi:cytoskeletal protein CcmA (bactofilin family)|nr:polymer-forming cytoskeletal protein [Betaproteobacteria bacterium SCN2]